MEKRKDFDTRAQETNLNVNSFYAVIPYPILRCKELSPMARLIYGEIASLVNKEGYCWASNQHFQDIFSVSSTTVSSAISSLRTLNFIETEVDIIHGNKRKIWLLFKDLTRKTCTPIQENLPTPIQENLYKDTHNEIHNKIHNIFNLYKLKIQPLARLTDNAKTKISTRLKSYSEPELSEAIARFSGDSWRMEHNAKFGPGWFFGSDEQIQKFLLIEPERKQRVFIIGKNGTTEVK